MMTRIGSDEIAHPFVTNLSWTKVIVSEQSRRISSSSITLKNIFQVPGNSHQPNDQLPEEEANYPRNPLSAKRCSRGPHVDFATNRNFSYIRRELISSFDRMQPQTPLNTYTSSNHIPIQFGLVDLTIGGGIVSSGNLSSIEWEYGLHFLQTFIDPADVDPIDLGTHLIMSVSYALVSGRSNTSLFSIEMDSMI